MKYRSAKGTTIEIPDGLTPKQIAAIKADADAGYATRAQQTAKDLARKAGSGALGSNPAAPAGGGKTLEQLNADKAQYEKEIARRPDGAPKFEERLNATNAAIAAAQGATGDNGALGSDPGKFNAQGYLSSNPDVQSEVNRLRASGDTRSPEQIAEDHWLRNGQAEGRPGALVRTDVNPDTKFDRDSVDTFLDGVLDKFQPLDLNGAPKVMSADDLEKFRQQNQDSLYNEETKYLDRDRARSLEEAKQEMANRGIPYNPAEAANSNSKDLYGRTIGSIDENYRTMQQSAMDRARTGADQRMATQASVNRSAYDAFMNSATSKYNSQLDAANTGNQLLNTLINEYGMTREEAMQKMKIKSDEKIARMMKGGSGGGGGGSGSGDSGGGFEITG